MESVSLSILTSFICPEQPQDTIFSKYINGSAAFEMPFKLYAAVSQQKTKKQKKRTLRGPYRKYSPE
jgi:hypothetical protein